MAPPTSDPNDNKDEKSAKTSKSKNNDKKSSKSKKSKQELGSPTKSKRSKSKTNKIQDDNLESPQKSKKGKSDKELGSKKPTKSKQNESSELDKTLHSKEGLVPPIKNKKPGKKESGAKSDRLETPQQAETHSKSDYNAKMVTEPDASINYDENYYDEEPIKLYDKNIEDGNQEVMPKKLLEKKTKI